MALYAKLSFLFAVGLDALVLRHTGVEEQQPAAANTFEGYYNQITKGRGIWKWNNALAAYQRHFGQLAGKAVNIGEVGVQSGGSLLMWRNVLGQQIQLFGFDINPKCKNFAGVNVTITLGDQADPLMWGNFFKSHPEGLDVLVDDGGHEAHQMLTTLQSGFPHIRPGGFHLTEDIMNPHILPTFWAPAATFIAQQAWHGLVEAVHVYPMVLVVQKTASWPTAPLQFSQQQVAVSNFTAMWTAINSVPLGTSVILKNAAWGSFLTEQGLKSIFENFIDLHSGGFKDTPKGCRTTAEAVCTNQIWPMTHVQARVKGVHVYGDHAVIEVVDKPPVIACTRKGNEWISYAF